MCRKSRRLEELVLRLASFASRDGVPSRAGREQAQTELRHAATDQPVKVRVTVHVHVLLGVLVCFGASH